mmetsp:Transcript_183312/g.581297  ORF Transcript_183312/g.581297 Transcript_183312/m.581297 type:complete len:298 (+) Transcript_183312:979-1872(+)
MLVPNPAEDIQEKHALECERQHGTVLLGADLHQNRHQPNHQGMREKSQGRKALRDLQRHVSARSVCSYARHSGAKCQAQLKEMPLHAGQCQVDGRHQVRRPNQNGNTCERSDRVVQLRDGVADHVVAQPNQQLNDSNAHRDSGKRLVGLPIHGSLSYELDVPQVGAIFAVRAAELVDVLPPPLEAPRVGSNGRGDGEGLRGGLLRAVQNSAISAGSRNGRVFGNIFLSLAEEEGDSEHLSGFNPLKLRGICAASFQLFPRRDGKPNQLCQQSGLVALGRHRGVHPQPDCQHQEKKRR